jgi:hypothetical protein
VDVKTFVSETLKQIQAGICEAIRDKVMVENDFGGVIKPVHFDIAVTITDENNKEGSGGLQVFGIGLAGKAATSSSASTVSRIQFEVPLVLPRNP